MPKILDNIEALHARKRAYIQAFNSPAGQEVLEDLARFCRAWESCWNKDARVHAVAEGRREVILRIFQHLNLTAEQLFDLWSGRYVFPNIEDAEIENES